MAKKQTDPAMEKVRSLYDKSGLSLHDLGMKMGYAEESARQSAFQFMKTEDPRIGMLRKFAAAVGIPLEELIASEKKKKNRNAGTESGRFR